MKRKRIFIIGLTSTSIWGMERHNLGNYAIMEPLIIYLKKEFPGAEIYTSIQMSDEFCKKFGITPKREKRFWTYGKKTAIITLSDIIKISFWALLKYIFRLDIQFSIKNSVILRELYESDLIIDFSGDMFGDNANFRRFLEDCAEILFAKILGKPVVMLAGSPGPFKTIWRKKLAKFVFNRVNLIINREPLSTELLLNVGVNPNLVKTTACPGFLFKPKRIRDAQYILKKENIISENKRPLVGLILCGWNMPKSPYYKIPRDDEELQPFIQLIEYLIEKLNVRVLLMSYQNRTDEKGNLIHGNDHAIISQIYNVLKNKNYGYNFFTLKGLYNTATSETIIGCFDMLISGRTHGAVAGLSQNIPTVIIDYGNEPKAHKLKGFAQVAGIEEYVCDPKNAQDMINKATKMWRNKTEIKKMLEKRIPKVKELAKYNFKLLREFMNR